MFVSPVERTAATLVSSQKIELQLIPSGPIKEGDTVHIICRVTPVALLDIVRLVRTIDGNEYALTNNDYLQNRFRKTDRYHVDWKSESEVGRVELKISGRWRFNTAYRS